MKRAVITGATGMIATSLINVLLKKDFEILAIVRPNSEKLNNIPKSSNVKVIECDLSELLTLVPKVSHNFNVFFHFGWIGTFGEDRNNSYIQLRNIQYTLDAVKLANLLNCKTFIGAGSQAEYGFTDEMLSSDLLVNPQTGYGIAKFAAGKLSKILANQLGLKHIWGRILSVYGPHDNLNSMVMSCIHTLLNDEEFKTTPGEQVWDYIYCDDCAKAFYLMSEYGHHGEVYPIGSGETKTLKEYIQIIKSNIGSGELGFGKINYYPNQVMHLCADISNLIEDTGFEPETSFEEGIKKTVEWFKENM